MEKITAESVPEVALDTDFYISDFKRENMPDRTPFMYAMITDKLITLLDRTPDSGAALISNYLKKSDITWFVKRVARDGSVLSIVLNKTDQVIELRDDAQRYLANKVANDIGNIALRWYDKEPETDALIPIYASGLVDLPDDFVDYFYDATMSYDQRWCSYCVMMKPEWYKILAGQKKYVKHILTDIMKGKRIVFYDDKSCIILMDKNNGKGPVAARAHAILCGVIFTMYGIYNATVAQNQYLEQIKW